MKYNSDFIGADSALSSFEGRSHHPYLLTIQRGDEISYTYHGLHSDNREESFYFIKKILLTLMWLVGGTDFKFNGDSFFFDFRTQRIRNDEEMNTSIKRMERIFQTPFSFTSTRQIYKDRCSWTRLNGESKGCRIGFDEGGSDRKVTAILDGKDVFSEEVLWSPKCEKDYHYHYNGILESLKHAASHLPHVDSIGISTAGVVSHNQLLEPTLFRSVPQEDKDRYVRSIFMDIARKEFSNVPVLVHNDGDISAFGGSLVFKKDNIVGLAFGTGLASGYCCHSSFNGWINEWGKIPLDYSPSAYSHYDLGTKGAGTEYLSQKGIIRLSKNAGISFDGTLPQQLVQIQKEADKNNPVVLECYKEMGTYLGSALTFFHRFLPFTSVLALGRVRTGKGGEYLLLGTKEYLQNKGLSSIEVFTSDEHFRRLGQSYIAGLR